jgi:plastocyanin
MRIAKVFLLVTLLSSVVAAHALAADHTVLMSGDYAAMFFDPASITITAGDRVRWQNVVAVQHTATSGTECAPDGIFSAGIMNPGQTSAYITFNTVGTFPYYCRFHCEMGMTGEVIVKQVPVPVRQKTWGAVKALFAALTTVH